MICKITVKKKKFDQKTDGMQDARKTAKIRERRTVFEDDENILSINEMLCSM